MTIRRALIVEDVSETRRWLGEIIIETFPECQIDEATDRRSGNYAIARGGYDLALIDLGLPDGSGLDVLRTLKTSSPTTLCVITTVMADDVHIVAALSAGAEGYILKETPPAIIARQLAALVEGVPALSPSIAQRIMQHFRLTGPTAQVDAQLTTREQEVLGLIGRGLRNGEAAAQLEVSENTIASHIKAIYRKLGISTRAEASWHATQMGLAGEPRRPRED